MRICFCLFSFLGVAVISPLMFSNDRVTRTRCLFWSHTPSIQESFSQRVMTGIASCGTWREEWRSARISTWWDCWPPFTSLFLLSLRLIASQPLCSLWLYSLWSGKWPEPDICPLSYVTQMSCFHAQWISKKDTNYYCYSFFSPHLLWSLLLSHHTLFPLSFHSVTLCLTFFPSQPSLFFPADHFHFLSLLFSPPRRLNFPCH